MAASGPEQPLITNVLRMTECSLVLGVVLLVLVIVI